MTARSSRMPLGSALVLMAAMLVACDNNHHGDDAPAKAAAQALFEPVPMVAGRGPIVPFPFDGLFAGFRDPTLNIPNDDEISFVSAVNEIDGFSTVADAYFDVAGELDYAKLPQNLLIIDASRGAPLVYGVDYVVQNSPATEEDPVTHEQTPISSMRSRVLIEWKKPLSPATTYAVVLGRKARTVDGAGVEPSPEFRIVSSATPVAEQTGPEVDAFDDEQKATLEALRSQLIRPLVVRLAAFGIPENDIALAYTFSTQSSGLSLAALGATATPGLISAANTGVTTDQALDNPLAAGATIHAGVLRVPYYLGNSGGDPQSIAPLSSFWLADATKPNIDPTDPTHKPAFLGQVPCAAFATGATVNGQTAQPSLSTTLCYPVPVRQSFETIPMLVSVPNEDSGQAKPLGGWPVVIFQHGITGDRSQAIAIAGTLARAGFVTVAIDLPLHGITDVASPFYRNQLFTGTPAAGLVTGERTFDLDLQNNESGAPGPDGVIDGSGGWFINLASLLTSRDNLRQASADLLTLAKSVPLLDLDQNGLPDIDGTRIRFAGLSLGSIVGIPFLANTADVGAATLGVPGGGLAKLLDASKSLGPVVAAGLAASGVDEGTDDYETFLRFSQTAVDDGDPIHYAKAAGTAHPIHLIEVVGGGMDADAEFTYPADTVVPNGAPVNDGTGAGYDRVVIAGALGGTDPLVAAFGLQDAGTIDVPVATASLATDPAGVRAVVRFREGTHGSLLDPTGGLAAQGMPAGTSTTQAATLEMQRQTANFLASDGLCLPIGQDCPSE